MIVQNYYTKYILGNTANADVANIWQYMVNDVLTLKYITCTNDNMYTCH